MILFIWNTQQKQIHSRDTGGRDEWEVTAKGYRVTFWSDENVLKLGSGGGYTTLWMY